MGVFIGFIIMVIAYSTIFKDDFEDENRIFVSSAMIIILIVVALIKIIKAF